jgi:hypothetical protein
MTSACDPLVSLSLYFFNDINRRNRCADFAARAKLSGKHARPGRDPGLHAYMAERSDAKRRRAKELGITVRSYATQRRPGDRPFVAI